jgi:hypothetical protein
MKFFTYLSAGLIAIPLVSSLPLSEAGVEVARDVDAPSVYLYGTHKKRDAEEDVPSIFGYLGYKKKRDAEEDVPSIFGYFGYKKRDAEVDAPSVYEYGTYKKE